jgi:hypothetical protein
MKSRSRILLQLHSHTSVLQSLMSATASEERVVAKPRVQLSRSPANEPLIRLRTYGKRSHSHWLKDSESWRERRIERDVSGASRVKNAKATTKRARSYPENNFLNTRVQEVAVQKFWNSRTESAPPEEQEWDIAYTGLGMQLPLQRNCQTQPTNLLMERTHSTTTSR